MKALPLTPYQAAVVYAALTMFRLETESSLQDIIINDDPDYNNYLLTCMNSAEEAALVMEQIKHEFGIVEK